MYANKRPKGDASWKRAKMGSCSSRNFGQSSDVVKQRGVKDGETSIHALAATPYEYMFFNALCEPFLLKAILRMPCH